VKKELGGVSVFAPFVFLSCGVKDEDALLHCLVFAALKGSKRVAYCAFWEGRSCGRETWVYSEAGCNNMF